MRLTRDGEFEYTTRCGGHWIHASVPALGGEDVAPNPLDYVVFGLGACVSAFVENWCWDNNLDPKGLTVEVDYKKSLRGLHNFKLTIDLPWVDTNTKWKEIISIVHQCPVHKTLAAHDIKVEVLR